MNFPGGPLALLPSVGTCLLAHTDPPPRAPIPTPALTRRRTSLLPPKAVSPQRAPFLTRAKLWCCLSTRPTDYMRLVHKPLLSLRTDLSACPIRRYKNEKLFLHDPNCLELLHTPLYFPGLRPLAPAPLSVGPPPGRVFLPLGQSAWRGARENIPRRQAPTSFQSAAQRETAPPRLGNRRE